MIKKKRGRKFGYVMSEKSKLKISTTMAGYTHTQETKDKIAESVKKYHDKRKGDIDNGS